MRITSKGQVTIPAHIRERAGLLPNTEVEMEYDGKRVYLQKARKPAKDGRGAKMIAALRGRGDIKMTTEQIMALMRRP